MKSFDIVGIGWPCVDYAMQVESLPKADRGARVRGTSWQGGGVVPTGLVAASRLGLRCALIGCVGDDMMGRFCYQDLLNHGVDLSRVRIRTDSTTDMAVVLSDEETCSRSILYRAGTTSGLKWEEVDVGFLCEGDYLYLNGCGEIEVQAAKVVKSRGGSVLVDAGYGRIRDYERLLPNVDCFIGSAYLYRNSFPDREDDWVGNLRQVQTMGPDTVAFTFGSESVRAVRGTECTEVPAFRVNASDTLGAGDVFHGAFFHGLVRNWPLEKTIRFASAVSAIKCTAPGGRAGIPTEKTVTEFLKTGRIDREEIQKRTEWYANGLDNYLRGIRFPAAK